jgi:fucose permease
VQSGPGDYLAASAALETAEPLADRPVLSASQARKGLAGFVLTGFFLSFLGAILPAWRYHIEPDFLLIGTYFLCQIAGVLAGVTVAYRLLPRRGTGFTLALACWLGFLGLVVLALFSPPAPGWARMAGLLLLGGGAGMLNTALFHLIVPAYDVDPAATVNLGGIVFGLGCLLWAVLVAGTFFLYTVSAVLLTTALLPAAAGVLYGRTAFPAAPELPQPGGADVWRDFRNPTAILFALLLFFQFGNEWALAGWLPLFLSQRLGLSPTTSLTLLALYWLVLLLGRLAAQWLLPRVSHARLLLGSVVAPMFGCLILTFTNNLFGAIIGVLLAGLGFSAIYPLLAEKIGHRFPYFHPGFFNGIFSVAMTGALLAPATLGYAAQFTGIGIVMALPFAGSVMVLLVLLAIMLAERISGGAAANASNPAG